MSGTEIRSRTSTTPRSKKPKDFSFVTGEHVIENTRFGQILRRLSDRPARIYVNGLLVAGEPDFAFSYNGTALTQTIRKALNRERTNVGRSAYSDRVKGMLLAAESAAVAEVLAKDLAALATGRSHEEVRELGATLGFAHVSMLGVRSCSLRPNSWSPIRRWWIGPFMMVVTIPATIAAKLRGLADVEGNPVRTLAQFQSEWSASIEYDFVHESDLTPQERAVYSQWRRIADLGGELPPQFKELKVSETMRPSITEGMHPGGIWEPATGRVIVQRTQLQRLETFARTLLHELTHARTGEGDLTREFERALTNVIGMLVARALPRSLLRSVWSDVSL